MSGAGAIGDGGAPAADFVRPPSLRDGDLIYIAHPAGPVPGAVVDAAATRLASAGFRVRHDPGMGSGPGYLAASDADRAADLCRALTDPDVSAVIAARGGYGCMRILDRLPPDLLRQRPRWLVGFSDVTALHLWALAQGVLCVHGPNASGIGTDGDPGSVEALLGLLRTGSPPDFARLRSLRGGAGRGHLVGGNLSLLAALAGTGHWPRREDVVLFVEDTNEPPYRIDRMLTTLRLTGRLRNVRGVALGHFTRCGGEGEADPNVSERIADLLADLEVPVVSGVPAGHERPNRPLLLGAEYVLDGDRGLLEPAEASGVQRSASSVGRATAGSPEPELRAPVFLLPRTRPNGVLGLIEQALRDGVCCAIQVDVSRGGEVTHRIAAGATGVTSDAARVQVTPMTRFDLASLTKALSTSLLAADAVERGLVALDESCPSDLIGGEASLRDLLRHAAGLPAYLPIWKEARAAPDPGAFARAAFSSVVPEPSTVGTGVYSDVGFIALGRWIERLNATTLDRLFASRIATRLGRASLAYLATDSEPDDRSGFAATEWCPWRRATLQGTVHDENAQVLGGACGHAGLFGTAADVGAVARSLLGHGPALLSPRSVDAMWDRAALPAGGSFVLGWDTPSSALSMAGSLMRRDATVGHLGYTGTSLWIDREREVCVTLLTNRVHPTRENGRIRDLRPALQDAAMRELGFGA